MTVITAFELFWTEHKETTSKGKSLQNEQDRERVQPSMITSAGCLVNVTLELLLKRTETIQPRDSENTCLQQTRTPCATVFASMISGACDCELLEVRTAIVAAVVRSLGVYEQGEGGRADGIHSATIQSVWDGSGSKVTEREAF